MSIKKVRQTVITFSEIEILKSPAWYMVSPSNAHCIILYPFNWAGGGEGGIILYELNHVRFFDLIWQILRMTFAKTCQNACRPLWSPLPSICYVVISVWTVPANFLPKPTFGWWNRPLSHPVRSSPNRPTVSSPVSVPKYGTVPKISPLVVIWGGTPARGLNGIYITRRGTSD